MSSHSTHILSASLLGGTVVLTYQLGLADGITLQSRRAPEPDFTTLSEDEAGPVIDTRPNLDPHQPERRHYRAILRYSSNEIRLLSNEVVLTVP